MIRVNEIDREFTAIENTINDEQIKESSIAILNRKKQLLADEYGVETYEDLYSICPEVSYTKSSISFTAPKQKK